MVITPAGHDPVVVVALDDYESLKEAACLLRGPENARRLPASSAAPAGTAALSTHAGRAGRPRGRGFRRYGRSRRCVGWRQARQGVITTRPRHGPVRYGSPAGCAGDAPAAGFRP
ncbi:hypothetical protein GCM10009716_17220 [Streptomyces sodiiphilus]|uniref:Antitoxin n=1 Tax=Streptomyces sodiiphilus TaxID=226217 RepID=A0ABP5ABE7_9ACTN